MTAAIRIEKLTKRYKRVLALDQVSLEVPPGIVFALLGENGAGKTTAMKLLLGLTAPTSGRTEVLGLDSALDSAQVRRRVGYVPERPALYEWMTVDEIGWFAAGFYGGHFLEHYRELARHFDLTADRKIKELSKGMRAKVSLALAMAHRPPLLLLDEPTSGLDPLVRRQFLESMVDLAASGQTVFLSSHQIAEVERVADRVAILRAGRLVLVEDLDRLKERTRELTITFANGASELPLLPGTLIQRKTEERQCRLMLQDLDPERMEHLRTYDSIGTIESRVPNLEEIFVAYMTTSELPKPEGGLES